MAILLGYFFVIFFNYCFTLLTFLSKTQPEQSESQLIPRMSDKRHTPSESSRRRRSWRRKENRRRRRAKEQEARTHPHKVIDGRDEDQTDSGVEDNEDLFAENIRSDEETEDFVDSQKEEQLEQKLNRLIEELTREMSVLSKSRRQAFEAANLPSQSMSADKSDTRRGLTPSPEQAIDYEDVCVFCRQTVSDLLAQGQSIYQNKFCSTCAGSQGIWCSECIEKVGYHLAWAHNCPICRQPWNRDAIEHYIQYRKKSFEEFRLKNRHLISWVSSIWIVAIILCLIRRLQVLTVAVRLVLATYQMSRYHLLILIVVLSLVALQNLIHGIYRLMGSDEDNFVNKVVGRLLYCIHWLFDNSTTEGEVRRVRIDVEPDIRPDDYQPEYDE